MASNKGNVVSTVEKLCLPVAEQLGLDLWDVEFVKEGSSYFLRIFIDKDEGITIDDCENMSKAIDSVLDEADPIDQSYCLEVSSPGIERALKKESHFKKYLGSVVKVKLFHPNAEGIKEFNGVLKSFDEGTAEIESQGSTVLVKLSEAAYIKLADEYYDLED